MAESISCPPCRAQSIAFLQINRERGEAGVGSRRSMSPRGVSAGAIVKQVGIKRRKFICVRAKEKTLDWCESQRVLLELYHILC